MRLDIEPNVAAPPVSDEVEERANVVPQEVRSMLDQGIKAAQAGNRALARMSLQTVTELDPKNESAWLWLASISEYPEELLGFLEHVLEINPQNQRANEWKTATHALLSKTFVQRGMDACEENQKDFATECFQKALEYNENNATAYLWMASLSDSNVVKISLLERALEIEPGNEPALNALEAAKQTVVKYGLTEAKAAAVSGNNADAISILDDLLSINPDSIEALTMKSHLVEGFDEKIRCFENILAIDPNNLAAKSGRDSLLAIFGTMEAAETESSSRHEIGYSNGEIYTAEVVESFEPSIDKSPTQDLELPAVLAEGTHFFDAPVASPEQETYTEVENDNDTVQAVAEPFATYAEEVSESPSFDFEAVKVEEESHDFFAMEDSHVDAEPEASYSDPHAETVAFSYDEIPAILAADEEPSSPSGELVIPMPESELPQAPVESAPVTVVVKPDTVNCVFCGNANDAQSISCHACMSVLTLSDLELLLANQDADKMVLRQAVEKMERKRSAGDDFSVEELTVLGLGHLNLRNLQLGYAALSEASRLDPNNVVLSSQVNSLLIRLEEIRLQEEAHLKMPKGKSILVVDDSATVRKLIAGKLEKSGHEVICANDGVEAMERLNDLIPDLVLLDIAMPRMDGYQVCKNIRSNAATKDVPVVMISGKDGFFDKVRGRMAGTTGYITKPFGPETLMKAVEMYLSGEAPDLDEV